MKKRSALVFLILFLFSFSAAFAADYPCKGNPVKNNINVRKAASTSSDKIATLKSKDSVTVLEEVTNKKGNLWYHIELSSGRKGYVLAEYIQLQDSQDDAAARSSAYPSQSYSLFSPGALQVQGNPSQPYPAEQSSAPASNETALPGSGEYRITFSTAHTGGSGYNNVGKAWTFYYELNGEKIDKAGSTADFIPGKEYTFYARIKEQDGKPDTGTNTVKYTPTESDLLNGFTVQQKVKVSENGGKYRGHSVTWTITWTIKRK